MHQIRFRMGSPDSATGVYSPPQTPQLDLRGLNLRGMRGEKGREMRGEDRKKRRAGERGGEVRLPIPNSWIRHWSDKSDSVNECTQEISESIKLHILGCGNVPLTFISPLANGLNVLAFSMGARRHGRGHLPPLECCKVFLCISSYSKMLSRRIM